MTPTTDRAKLVAALRHAGFVSAEDEAALLLRHAGGDGDHLDRALRRRLSGEPLAWIVAETTFCGRTIRIQPGVYVPREHSEELARRAIALLPGGGTAVEICTGSGAIAHVIGNERPGARIVATDLDPVAVACARGNGVEAFEGDLFAPLPDDLRGRVDVVIGVVPYVPSDALDFLQRDTLAFESTRSYDGGVDGVDVLERAVVESTRFLRPGGTLLLELGVEQADLLTETLGSAGFDRCEVRCDDDGDVRSIEATLGKLRSSRHPVAGRP